MNKIAVVTGGTSGIGKTAALALKNDGWTVYELSRREKGVEGINHIAADITERPALSPPWSRFFPPKGALTLW